MKKVKKMFNIYGYDGGNYAGNVYNIDGISPTITCIGGGGGNRMPMILVEDERGKRAADSIEFP